VTEIEIGIDDGVAVQLDCDLAAVGVDLLLVPLAGGFEGNRFWRG